MNKVDARGYSCPEPVIMTKQALRQGTPLLVLVDSMIPVQNIMRFAASAGYQVSYQVIGEDFELTISQ